MCDRCLFHGTFWGRAILPADHSIFKEIGYFKMVQKKFFLSLLFLLSFKKGGFQQLITLAMASASANPDFQSSYNGHYKRCSCAPHLHQCRNTHMGFAGFCFLVIAHASSFPPHRMKLYLSFMMSLFIHSSNLYWVPCKCQKTSWALGVQWWTNRDVHFGASWGYFGKFMDGVPKQMRASSEGWIGGRVGTSGKKFLAVGRV